MHTPEEAADGYPGTPYWFAQEHPGKEGSTHYFVSYLGFVYQCVEEYIAPIANGVLNKPYPAWADSTRSLNRQTISVEVEGYAATIAQTISAAQKKALVDLLAYGCRKFGIPAERSYIIGHYEVASNRSDPGSLNIDAIVADVKAALQPPQEETMKLLRGTPSGAVCVIGESGKRYIDDEKELAAYISAGWDSNIVSVPDATLAAIPDVPTGGSGAGPTTTQIVAAIRAAGIKLA